MDSVILRLIQNYFSLMYSMVVSIVNVGVFVGSVYMSVKLVHLIRNYLYSYGDKLKQQLVNNLNKIINLLENNNSNKSTNETIPEQIYEPITNVPVCPNPYFVDDNNYSEFPFYTPKELIYRADGNLQNGFLSETKLTHLNPESFPIKSLDIRTNPVLFNSMNSMAMRSMAVESPQDKLDKLEELLESVNTGDKKTEELNFIEASEEEESGVDAKNF